MEIVPDKWAGRVSTGAVISAVVASRTFRRRKRGNKAAVLRELRQFP